MADIQVDTNILLRSVEPDHPSHAAAVNSVSKILERGDRVCVVAQNLIEFWNVATRPIASNGLGWQPAKTFAEIGQIEGLLTILPDHHTIYVEWKRLVLKNAVVGRQVHDARIVAAMKVNNISMLLTFNRSDFKRYKDIEIIEPENIQA